MRKIKRTLASLLAALLLVTSLPVTALAADNDAAGEEAAVQTVQTVDPAEQPAEEDPAGVNPVEEPAAVDVDPEDVELVGLVANVNGVEIYAMPSVATMSLLPLETKTNFTLDLTGFFPEELKSVELNYLLANIKTGSEVALSGNSNIAAYARWSYYDPETGDYVYQNDNYALVDGSMDLSFMARYPGTSTFTLELIVGTANQLDATNKRYRVQVTTSSQNPFQFETAEPDRICSQSNSMLGDNTFRHTLTIDVDSAWEVGNTLPLLLKLNDALAASVTDVTVTYQAPGASDSSDITAAIYKTGVNTPSGYDIPLTNSYNLSTMPMLTVTMTRIDSTTPITRTIYLRADKSADSVGLLPHLYDPADTASDTYVTNYFDFGDYDSEHRLQPYIYEMLSGKAANGTWAARATYSHNSSQVAFADLGTYITRTVVGYYTTAAETVGKTDITNQLFATGYGAGYQADYSNGVYFTIVKADNTLEHRYIKTVEPADSIDVENYLYDPTDTTIDSSVTYYQTRGDYDSEHGGLRPYIYEMHSGRDVSGMWVARAHYWHNGARVAAADLSTYITCTVVGYYATAAETVGKPDITNQLFATGYGQGYQANYSDGVYFTIVKNDNTLEHLCIKTIPYVPWEPSSETYLDVTNAYKAANGSSYNAYRISDEHDGYGDIYQTIFLMNYGWDSESNAYTYSPITETAIYPVFSAHSRGRVYAGNSVPGAGGTQQTGGVPQNSGESAQPFDAANPQPIQYTVYSEDWAHYQNYWVTFITQQAGAKLFVNGVTNAAESHKVEQEDGTKIATREVHLDSADSYHDIFFANIGNAEMTGLTLTATELENVAIDPYWTIQNNSTLAGLTTTNTASYSELPNVGKVRLRPIIDPDTGLPMPGPISGTLTFTHDGGEEVKVKLIGTSGQLKITTDRLNEGVKYVPYISAIQTNYIGSGAATSLFTFSIISGVSNTDITLYPTGELYGMPMRPGTWTFTVRVRYSGYTQAEWDALSDESKTRLSAEKTFTLVIYDNLDDLVVSVPGENAYGYEVLNFIGDLEPQDADLEYNHYVLYQYEDWDFRSEGPYPEFVNFYIDGLLVATSKYDARDGSTVITIYGDTFEETGEGQHTIAAEFFDGGNPANLSTMKTSAQNYYMEAPATPNPGPAPVIPAPAPTPTPTPTPDQDSTQPDGTDTPDPSMTPAPVEPEIPFNDVHPGDWFYDNVKWVYDHGYMVGESDSRFDPDGLISQASIVVVLARLANIDLTRFAGITMEDVPAGTWYTEAAIWAKQIGLLPDNTLFTGEAPLARESMAIMLVKYLRSLGMDTTLTEQAVVFSDADSMTPDGNAAFQVLYNYNVFRGYGNNEMGPANSITRAEFSALVQRISGLMDAEG